MMRHLPSVQLDERAGRRQPHDRCKEYNHPGERRIGDPPESGASGCLDRISHFLSGAPGGFLPMQLLAAQAG
jgi:hypothetical protein